MVGLQQHCPLSPFLFIICVTALSQDIRATVQGLVLDPYVSAPDAQSISHLIFADDCLLAGQNSSQNVASFRRILEEYCLMIMFNPRMRTQLRLAIRDTLEIEEYTRLCSIWEFLSSNTA